MPITVSRRLCALALIYHLFSEYAGTIVTAQLSALISYKNERRNFCLCIESLQAIADDALNAVSQSIMLALMQRNDRPCAGGH